MQSRAILSVIVGFGLGLTYAVAAATEAMTSVLAITIDQAKVAKIPTGTATLVVGNPAIADVTMLKGGLSMVVTAKGYGQTNLVAVDASGNILDEKQIRVDPARTMLVVQRGAARSSYSCNPWCMPTVQLGDDNTVFGEAGGQISHAQRPGDGNGERQVTPARRRFSARGARAQPMRRLIVEEPLSRAAVWSRRTAVFALATAAVSIAIARFGGVDPSGALAVFGAALVLAFLAALLAGGGGGRDLAHRPARRGPRGGGLRARARADRLSRLSDGRKPSSCRRSTTSPPTSSPRRRS